VQIDYWANTCSGADWEGEKCGDQYMYWPACDIYSGFTVFQTASGHASRWMYARATECSACSSPIEHLLELQVPAGIDYDLYVYSACGQLWTSATSAGTGHNEYATFSKPDRGLYDDSYNYWVEVRFRSGSSCEPWILTFRGRNEP
jgi:hypothetical protein